MAQRLAFEAAGDGSRMGFAHPTPGGPGLHPLPCEQGIPVGAPGVARRPVPGGLRLGMHVRWNPVEHGLLFERFLTRKPSRCLTSTTDFLA